MFRTHIPTRQKHLMYLDKSRSDGEISKHPRLASPLHCEYTQAHSTEVASYNMISPDDGERQAPCTSSIRRVREYWPKTPVRSVLHIPIPPVWCVLSGVRLFTNKHLIYVHLDRKKPFFKSC
ncbi:hypothetical protein ElyMa_001862400 [Elysia marginata]|uniref:Uncharacterized protein n=1 Tax=Elysia marginata TaxID=1093978 RepID=A0AAV4EMW8_9GAST|nr:hypothetical protein ElyMa_001862400 [Elysia marginata]